MCDRGSTTNPEKGAFDGAWNLTDRAPPPEREPLPRARRQPETPWWVLALVALAAIYVLGGRRA